MKNISYYRASGESDEAILIKASIDNWRWKIPEGQTEISVEEAKRIVSEFNTFESTQRRKLDRLELSETEIKRQELYQDICTDMEVDPEDVRIKELFRRACIKNPFMVNAIHDQFTKDIKLFIKNETE
jgi:hypothetical protein